MSLLHYRGWGERITYCGEAVETGGSILKNDENQYFTGPLIHRLFKTFLSRHFRICAGCLQVGGIR